VRIGAEAHHAAELGAALRDVLAAPKRLLCLGGLGDARLVDLNELAQVAGRLEHRVELEVNTRAPHVPEDQDLGIL